MLSSFKVNLLLREKSRLLVLILLIQITNIYALYKRATFNFNAIV